MIANVRVIGIVRSNGLELRFLYVDGRWEPDLVVNHDNGTTSEPPPCFTPNDETIKALNFQLLTFVEEIANEEGMIRG